MKGKGEEGEQETIRQSINVQIYERGTHDFEERLDVLAHFVLGQIHANLSENLREILRNLSNDSRVDLVDGLQNKLDEGALLTRVGRRRRELEAHHVNTKRGKSRERSNERGKPFGSLCQSTYRPTGAWQSPQDSPSRRQRTIR